jgi:hypothetical protein
VAQIWGDIRLNIKEIVLPDDDDFIINNWILYYE